MKLRHILYMVLVFCVYSDSAIAQSTIWKKDIARLINYNDSLKGKTDTSLTGFLLTAAVQGTATSYSNIDAFFSKQLTTEEINFQIFNKNSSDTSHILDPKTGKEKTSITPTFDAKTITKYKLHEEWVFDPINFHTEIHIKGIAPAKELHRTGEAHPLTQQLLWFRYNEVEKILSQNARLHPKHNIYTAIWNDYMNGPNLKLSSTTSGSTQKRLVSHMIYIDQPEDIVNSHLRDISPDTTYIEMLINAVKAGRITAYSNKDSSFKTALDTQTFNKLFESAPDTVEVDDPEVGGQKTLAITRKVFDPYSITKYRLLEEWDFDPVKGEIKIQVLAIAPMLIIYNDDQIYKGTTTMFWIRINDFKTILPAYEVYHPQHTFADIVWESYFQTSEHH